MNTRIIDKTKEIEAIREKYNVRFSRDQRATDEVCELWGIKPVTEDSISTTDEILVEVGRCWATMNYMELPCGSVIYGLTATFSVNGFASPASIWDGKAFLSLSDARNHAVRRAIYFFQQNVAVENTCSSITNNKSAIKAVEILQELLTPQLELF